MHKICLLINLSSYIELVGLSLFLLLHEKNIQITRLIDLINGGQDSYPTFLVKETYRIIYANVIENY